MFHYRKNRQRYSSFPKPDGCSFCTTIQSEHLIEQTDHHYIVANRVMYDVWELRRVTNHLMIIPKRHVTGLGDLSDAEKIDHITLAAKYEQAGYNIYARGIGSLQRSVAHQHTHLIKTKARQALGSFIIRRPYFLINF